jgi:hypothetical protein
MDAVLSVIGSFFFWIGVAIILALGIGSGLAIAYGFYLWWNLRQVTHCALCGTEIKWNPANRRTFKAYKIVYCPKCVPRATISQLADVATRSESPAESAAKVSESLGNPPSLLDYQGIRPLTGVPGPPAPDALENYKPSVRSNQECPRRRGGLNCIFFGHEKGCHYCGAPMPAEFIEYFRDRKPNAPGAD